MVLITGGAGFIGYHLTKHLLFLGYEVISIDCFTPNYNVTIKKNRISDLINLDVGKHLTFFEIDLLNKKKLERLFIDYDITDVIHLAAISGVRNSTLSSNYYIENNIIGFNNIIELCSKIEVNKFLYASSSSVYSNEIEYSLSKESDISINNKSIYAFTKKSNEILANTYFNLFNLSSIGLRFFSVYGPNGRPDMSYYLFTKSILKSQPIYLHNNGECIRDFTYIDDVVIAISKLLISNTDNGACIFNLGSGCPIKIKDLVKEIELIVNVKAEIINSISQKEDAITTGADTALLQNKYDITFDTNIHYGMKRFINWYKNFVV